MNVLTSVEKGLETVGHDIVIAVEFLPKAEKVIATAIKDQPAVKAAVLELIAQGTKVVGDVSTVAADKGINLAADTQALTDAEAFFTYFKNTFIPAVEAVYEEVKADVA
jgi:hypothetical protein